MIDYSSTSGNFPKHEIVFDCCDRSFTFSAQTPKVRQLSKNLGIAH